MTSWPILTVAIEHEGDIVAARQRGRRIAELVGFERQDQTRIATAISEIARNAHAYGGGGKVEYGLQGKRTPGELVIRVTDQGPGIDDLEAVLGGSYTSPGGLGVGLLGAQRLMDGFSVENAPQGGTIVTLRKHLPRGAVAITPARLAEIGRLLVSETAGNPLEALREQNRELVESLDALEKRGLEASRLSDELERTNKGVVALYAELDLRAIELTALNATLEQRVSEGVAAREKVEETLRQSQKMEAVGQLTGGIAHDFNNLLMIIGGSLEMLRRRVPADPNITRLIDAASQGVARGGSLNQQLLAFARRQDLKSEVFLLADFLFACGALIERAVREDIALEVESKGIKGFCKTDPHQLETAVLNLAINARDAMPKGGTLTIALGESVVSTEDALRLETAAGDYLSVCVADTGEGMTAETQARIFEPFFTTKELGRGTGLGLSQVYGFAKQSGGFVTVESEIDVGTHVTIHLPKAKAPELSTETLPPAPARVTGSATILLVEDDAAVRAITSEMLRDLGYTVQEAGTGPAALEILDDYRFDIVFSDVILPHGMSGVNLAAEIRRRRPNLPILLTSGYTAQHLDVQANHGLSILRKPYNEAALSEAINKALNQIR